MAEARRANRWRSSTNKSVVVLGVFGVLIAVCLLWISQILTNLTGKSILSNVGGLVLATALISVGWELLGKRSFADEIMAKAHLSTDIARAGIDRVTDQYLDEVEWDRLFHDANKVDIVVAYARTWRHAQLRKLQAVAARKGRRIRVFLPDPDDTLTMQILAKRFATTTTDVQTRVREAMTEFAGLQREGGADVQVYKRAGDLVFSCYRFDSRAVITLYSHSQERQTSVPTWVVEEGDLWKFAYSEIQAILDQSTPVLFNEGDASDATSE